MNRTVFVVPGLVLAGIAPTLTAGVTEILVDQDYMSSGFFQSDYLRGEEADSTRATNRATSPTIFGLTGETTYFGFGFDPTAFTGPVSSAVFRAEIVTNGFFGDPSESNPADISLHSLSSDPLASVDQSLASGAGSWIDFRDSEITTGSIVSTTKVTGLGVYEWDITALVNEWILNGDANLAYTIGTSALTDPEGEAAVAFANSSYFEGNTALTGRIVIVPAPGALGLLSLGLLGAARRRR